MLYMDADKFLHDKLNKYDYALLVSNKDRYDWFLEIIVYMKDKYSALPCRITYKKNRLHYNTIDGVDYLDLMMDWQKKLFGKLSFHHSKTYQVMIEK